MSNKCPHISHNIPITIVVTYLQGMNVIKLPEMTIQKVEKKKVISNDKRLHSIQMIEHLMIVDGDGLMLEKIDGDKKSTKKRLMGWNRFFLILEYSSVKIKMQI